MFNLLKKWVKTVLKKLFNIPCQIFLINCNIVLKSSNVTNSNKTKKYAKKNQINKCFLINGKKGQRYGL